MNKPIFDIKYNQYLITNIIKKINTQSEKKIVEFIPLSEAAKLTGYTPEYLNSLSRSGKLRAEKIGRNWYTKTAWVNDFLAKVSVEATSVDIAVEPKGENREEKVKTTLEVLGVKQEEGNKGEEKIEIEKTEILPQEVLAKLEDMKHPKPKNNWLRIFAVASSAVIILPIFFAGTHIVKNFIQNNNVFSNQHPITFVNQVESKIVNENFGSGQVAGEEVIGGVRIVSASENFRVSEINIGGDMMMLANGENMPLEINNIKSESYLTNKNDEAKLVVSWQTNKMALSELAYSKNSGQEQETIGEDSYGFNHSVVIPGLDQGSSYVYQIKSKDRWANEKSSDYFGIYTSSKPVSIFELIANALGEVFGWALKK